MSWPPCRSIARGTHGGVAVLWLGGGLIRAVSQESAAAIMHNWRASTTSVWRWRQLLGVTHTNNEGTHRLVDDEAGTRSINESLLGESIYELSIPLHTTVDVTRRLVY